MKKAIIDIDGVLNNYPDTQLDYFEFMTGVRYKNLMEAKNTLSYVQYRVLKQGYRESAFKHNAKPSKGAKKLLKYLRDNDYLIYIITARELFKYNQLEKTILSEVNVQKPSFRQIISHNIRYKDESINKTLKTLDKFKDAIDE